MSFFIRDVEEDDLALCLRYNRHARDYISPVPESTMNWLREKADYFRVAVSEKRGNKVIGFLIGLGPETNITPYHQWFYKQFGNFVYIDRVCVSQHHRRMGVAQALYDDVEQFARARQDNALTCEVCIKPLNVKALAFHESMGFESALADDSKNNMVRLLVKHLN